MKLFKSIILACGFLCLPFAFGDEPKGVEVTVTVPDSAWKLEILEVYGTDDELIVISKVSRAGDTFGLQVITTLNQKLNLIVPNLPVKHYVLGKTWGWENQDKGVEFIKDRKQLDEKLKRSKQLYPKP